MGKTLLFPRHFPEKGFQRGANIQKDGGQTHKQQRIIKPRHDRMFSPVFSATENICKHTALGRVRGSQEPRSRWWEGQQTWLLSLHGRQGKCPPSDPVPRAGLTLPLLSPACANEVQLCPWLVAALFVIAKKTENKYPPMVGNGSMTSQYFHIEECEAGCTENDREDYPDTVFN